MLVLLPPSEGKATPVSGPPVDLGALVFADDLAPVRALLLAAVDPALAHAPAAPAAEVYTGVLFARLGLGDLTPAARRRAAESVLIASGLWGLLRPDDRIPAYKLPIGTKLAGIGGLGALWRPAVTAALAERDVDSELFVDCRSGPYATVWRPRRAARVEVRAFRVAADGSRSVISHMAKASRGDVARALLTTRRSVRRPRDVAAAVAAAGVEAELAPAGPGAWTLDVLEQG